MPVPDLLNSVELVTLLVAPEFLEHSSYCFMWKQRSCVRALQQILKCDRKVSLVDSLVFLKDCPNEAPARARVVVGRAKVVWLAGSAKQPRSVYSCLYRVAHVFFLR